MMHLVLFLALATKEPKPQVDAPARLVSIRVQPDAFNRAHDEAELMRLLLEDFRNMDEKRSRVDLQLRRRISKLMKRIQSEQ